MQDVIDSIMQKTTIRRKDHLRELLAKSMHVSSDKNMVAHSVHENVVFKVEAFFKGFAPLVDNNYQTGVELFTLICEELGIEIEKEEAFIMVHLRNLGKFRKKESVLLEELKALWREHKDYALEGNEFSYALQGLRKLKFIEYRRGNMYINTNMIIRYREERF